jgi:formylglycine-generating enzyme required for sulfatase activity
MEAVLLRAARVVIGESEHRESLPNEQPAHEMPLSHFLIDVEPVSVGAFARFLNLVSPTDEDLAEWCLIGPADPRADYLPLERVGATWQPRPGVPSTWPMIMVSWFGANAYSLWADEQDYRGYRNASTSCLPTEAQWEYASRGAGSASFPWGELPPSADRLNVCWDLAALCADTPLAELPIAPVTAQLGLSPCGARGMAGNVWQWCRDTYDARWYASAAASQPDAWNDAAAGPKAERGGSWVGPAYLARSSYRRGRVPGAKGRCLGFRCVGVAIPHLPFEDIH